MSQVNKSRARREAWRIFQIQAVVCVLVVALAAFPALFLAERNHAMASVLCAAALVLGISLYCATRLMGLLEEAHDKVTTLTTHDDLTRLPNRRWFFTRLDEELDRSRRYGSGLSLVMVDIDHFRKVNDTFGHPLGDLALAEVARLISANVRTSDVVARYGGEEFMILLPESNAEQAVHVAEKLRAVVEVNDISMEGPEVKVTISCGVADLSNVRPTKGCLRDAFVKAADHAMHRAKENGRNQVLVHAWENSQQLRLV